MIHGFLRSLGRGYGKPCRLRAAFSSRRKPNEDSQATKPSYQILRTSPIGSSAILSGLRAAGFGLRTKAKHLWRVWSRTRESQESQPWKLRFRALLTDDGAQVHFHRERLDQLSEILVAGVRSTKAANNESLGSPWGCVTGMTETFPAVSLGGSVSGLRVNRTKVQAKTCSSARCAKPLHVSPYV
jgi:hypothetical protein